MIGRRMPSVLRAAYAHEMNAARTAADATARWRHLERAHILSQPWPWPHTRNRCRTARASTQPMPVPDALAAVLEAA
ncbi:MAG TPA: DUF3703 domain-containing protein [Nonomuraea sp.]|nr:DUF3703 domain-containing protein [Nonomuraea sp.]